MKALVLALAFFSVVAQAETRCGWLDNPTPANYWLTDADGTWTMSVQGGYQAEGLDLIEYPSDDQYVDVNGNYGYFCACMNVETDSRTERILKVKSAKAKLLKDCLKDPNLPSYK